VIQIAPFSIITLNTQRFAKLKKIRYNHDKLVDNLIDLIAKKVDQNI